MLLMPGKVWVEMSRTFSTPILLSVCVVDKVVYCLGVALLFQLHPQTLSLTIPTNINHASFGTSYLFFYLDSNMVDNFTDG